MNIKELSPPKKTTAIVQLVNEEIFLPDRYTLNPDAYEQQSEMLALAQCITGITNASDMALAAETGATLQRYIKSVDEARMSLARPLNEAAKKLIQFENDHCAPLIEEKERIGRLITSFKKFEADRVAEENRKRAIEIQRLEDERRKAEERARKAATKPNEARAMEMELKAYHAAEAATAAIMVAPTVAAKAKGAATKRSLKFKVLDARQVYAARPELCSLEVKASAVNAVIFASPSATEYAPDTTTVPGLALYWTETTSFRS